MHRILVLILVFFSLVATAQKGHAAKKPARPGKTKPVVDTAFVNPADTIDWDEFDIVNEKRFAVYTRRNRGKDRRLRLCVNLVGDTMYNYCNFDSTCRDPELFKIMFTKKEADTTFILLLVDAFSKAPDRPECAAGRETRLMFFRWNTATNQAVVKQRNVSSCMKGITNMTKTPISEWDGSSVLSVSYHRGSKFLETRFDPSNYRLGLQSVSD